MPPSKRQHLVQAALRLFQAHGYRATGIDAILKEADVSRMTLYNHFKSKDELILATLELLHDQLEDRLDTALQTITDPIDRLLAVFDINAAWLTSTSFHGCAFVNAAAETEPAPAAASEATSGKRSRSKRSKRSSKN